MIPDLGELLQSEFAASSSILPPSSGDWDLSTIDTPFHQAYHPFSAIEAFVDELERTFPEVVEAFEIGKSAEGRSIRAMRITTRRPAPAPAPTPSPEPEDPMPPSELASAWSLVTSAARVGAGSSWWDWLQSLTRSSKSKHGRRKHKKSKRRKHKKKQGKKRPTGPPPEIYIQAGQHAREVSAHEAGRAPYTFLTTPLIDSGLHRRLSCILRTISQVKQKTITRLPTCWTPLRLSSCQR